ncbi:MAG: adenylyltransferase/cytidyltransferase family protein [Patescibacteria group bacterium]
MQNKILVFGTFGKLHEGHLYFLTEAKKLGDLYVSVSSDESALQRKGKNPIHNIKERIEAIKKLGIAEDVAEGDKTLNSWTAIKEWQPNIICVGFDQYGLKTALADIAGKFGFDIKVISQKDNLEI